MSDDRKTKPVIVDGKNRTGSAVQRHKDDAWLKYAALGLLLLLVVAFEVASNEETMAFLNKITQFFGGGNE